MGDAQESPHCRAEDRVTGTGGWVKPDGQEKEHLQIEERTEWRVTLGRLAPGRTIQKRCWAPEGALAAVL